MGRTNETNGRITKTETTGDITDLGRDLTAGCKKGEFRLNAKQIHLTYKTHLIKAEFKAWLYDLCGGDDRVDELYLAHESGDKAVPYPHTHVVCKLGFRPNWKNASKLDYNSIHPHIQVLQTKAHWDNAVRYMAKEDPENAHLKDYRTRKPHEIIDGDKTLLENIERLEIPVRSYNDVKIIHEAKSRVEAPDEKSEARLELMNKNAMRSS